MDDEQGRDPVQRDQAEGDDVKAHGYRLGGLGPETPTGHEIPPRRPRSGRADELERESEDPRKD